VRNLAAEEATALHHSWIGEDHLVLALLHPDCPGAEGRSIGPVEIPPGCWVKARHERD
jgi:hypothetical protein